MSGKSYVMKEMCTGGWDEKEKELSMNEVNILASCNHINVVRYFFQTEQPNKLK